MQIGLCHRSFSIGGLTSAAGSDWWTQVCVPGCSNRLITTGQVNTDISDWRARDSSILSSGPKWVLYFVQFKVSWVCCYALVPPNSHLQFVLDDKILLAVSINPPRPWDWPALCRHFLLWWVPAVSFIPVVAFCSNVTLSFILQHCASSAFPRVSSAACELMQDCTRWFKWKHPEKVISDNSLWKYLLYWMSHRVIYNSEHQRRRLTEIIMLPPKKKSSPDPLIWRIKRSDQRVLASCTCLECSSNKAACLSAWNWECFVTS